MTKTIKLACFLIDNGVDDPLRLQKILFLLCVKEKQNQLNMNGSYFDNDAKFMGWVYGPVIQGIHREFIPYFAGIKSLNKIKKEIGFQNDDDKAIKDRYNDWIEEYNEWKTYQLISYSHRNKEWKKSREGLKPNQPGFVKLDDTSPDFLEFED